MTMRRTISGGAPWEAVVGYSRAVRVGPYVTVSGTTSVGPDGAVIGAGDMAAQTRRIFEIIGEALTRAGAGFGDVVRTRMFVTDITRWEEVAGVHGEIFGAIRPAATMVEVARLIDPALLVEIEVDAIVAEAP